MIICSILSIRSSRLPRDGGFFLKIKTQFLASIIFIIMLSISLMTYVSVTDTRDVLQQEIKAKAEIMTNSIRGVAVESFVKKDVLSLNYYIREAASSPGILYIIVTDRFDTISGSNNPEDMGKETSQVYPELKKAGDIGSIRYMGKELKAINFVSDFSMKARGRDLEMGKIYIGFDRSVIDSRINAFYFKGALIGVSVMLLAILLTLLITGRIIKPLNQLIEGTRRIASGDMKYKIKVNVKNEFQALANSFNDMTGRLEDYYEGILNAFTIAADSKNKYNPSHSHKVSRLAAAIGRAMKLPAAQVESIRIASILMDIGNIGVRDAVLNKTEVLTPEDFIQIQQHPEIGAKILKNIPALREVVPIILQHHERYDGMGYPAGLRANGIMTEAKIIAIADAYDAMITERGHRKAVDMEEAVYELRNNKGKQFDPLITEVFIEALNKGCVQ